MAKSNQTANEAQLKARRTSLGKKTTDELITIILRKDKSERSMNSKIRELTALLKEANELNEDKDIRMRGMKDFIKARQEQIKALVSENNDVKSELDIYSKKYVNVKHLAHFRKNVIFVTFTIIIILSVLLFI